MRSLAGSRHLSYLDEARAKLLFAYEAVITDYTFVRNRVVQQREALVETAKRVLTATQGQSLVIAGHGDIKSAPAITIPPAPKYRGGHEYRQQLKDFSDGFSRGLPRVFMGNSSRGELVAKAAVMTAYAAYVVVNAQRALRDMAAADAALKVARTQMESDRALLRRSHEALVETSTEIHRMDSDMRDCLEQLEAGLWDRYRAEDCSADDRSLAERLLGHAAMSNA